MNINVPHKIDRKLRNSTTDITKDEAFKAAMARAGAVGANVARKKDKDQRAARAALAETFEDWAAWKKTTDGELLNQVLAELALVATAGNRAKILKHNLLPQDVAKFVLAEVEKRKAEADKGDDASVIEGGKGPQSRSDVASGTASKTDADPFDD